MATLVLDVLVMLIYVYLLMPEDGIRVLPERALNTFARGILILMTGVGVEMYIDRVRMVMYEQMKMFSDKIRRVTEENESFFEAMSKEVQSPLQSLTGSAELIQQCVDKGQQSALVSIVKNSCETIANLVSNVLDIPKIEAMNLRLTKVPSGLNEGVNKVLRLWLARANAKGLKLEYLEPHPLSANLLLDPQRIHQVVFNLVSNAVKFTEKGQVVVSASWLPSAKGQSPEQQMQTELRNSSWNQVFDPLKEVEDPEKQLLRMKCLSTPSVYIPSSMHPPIEGHNDR